MSERLGQPPIEEDDLARQPQEPASEQSAEKVLDELDWKILDMEKAGDLKNTTAARKIVEENLYGDRDKPNLLRLNSVEKAINKIYFGEHSHWKSFAKDREDAIRGADKGKEYSSTTRFYRSYFEGEVWSGRKDGNGQVLGVEEEALHQNFIDFIREDENTWCSSPVGHDDYGAATAGTFPAWLDKSIITPPDNCELEKDVNSIYINERRRYDAHFPNLGLSCRILLSLHLHNNGQFEDLEITFHSKADADKFGQFLWQQRLDEHREEWNKENKKKQRAKAREQKEPELTPDRAQDLEAAERLSNEIEAMPAAIPENDPMMDAIEESFQQE